MAQTGKETFGLKVMSANGVFFDGRAESVTIPCKDGSMQILAHHEEMIVAIYQGDMKIVSADGGELEVIIGNGSCQIANNRCTILAMTCERPEDIDRNRAREALELAQEHMRQNQSKREYHLSQVAMARALTRLKLSSRYEN